MYTDKITQAVAEAVKQILATEKLHPNQHDRGPRGVTQEDLEKIDELSKTTLGSYIKKAANDKADRAYGNGFWDSRGGRTTYPPEDTPIKNKTEVDQKQRNAGIKKAVNKLTKEDIGQIDELSKTTLGSYIKKAADDKSKTAYDRGYVNYATDGPKPERVSWDDKVEAGQRRRNAGIKRAVNKLTREELSKDVKEGWNDMLDDVKKRAAPQPNGGAGMKQGSRYGGSKQKDEPEDKKPMKEDMDINAINGVKMSNVDESSHQAKTTMKHIPNASPELKKAAKDIKPGIAGFRDRVAMLKAGGVKK